VCVMTQLGVHVCVLCHSDVKPGEMADHWEWCPGIKAIARAFKIELDSLESQNTDDWNNGYGR